MKNPQPVDDEICVETTIAAVGGASLEMAQKILRGHDVLLTANVRIAMVAGGKARRIPQEILTKFKQRAFSVTGVNNC